MVSKMSEQDFNLCMHLLNFYYSKLSERHALAWDAPAGYFDDSIKIINEQIDGIMLKLTGSISI